MKRVKNLIKNNIKLLIGIIIGGVLFGGMGAYAATIAASSVSYTSNGQSNVNGALDELYTRANNMVPIDPDTFNTNTAKTVYASSKGVCIKRNNKLNCFKINNWSEEQNHIQQVFSDISCNVNSSDVICNASDFFCHVYSSGRVFCNDQSDNSDCRVDSNGSVHCY